MTGTKAMEQTKHKLSLAAKRVEQVVKGWDGVRWVTGFYTVERESDRKTWQPRELSRSAEPQTSLCSSVCDSLLKKWGQESCWDTHTIARLPPAPSWTVNPLWAVEAGQWGQGTRLAIISMIATALVVLVVMLWHWWYWLWWLWHCNALVVLIDCDDSDESPSNTKHSGSVWPLVGDKKLLDPPVCHCILSCTEL